MRISVALVSAAAGCAAPRPSTEPLGVGPLPASYHLATRTAPRVTDRKAPAVTARSEPKAASGPDAGAKAEPRTAETADTAHPGAAKDKGAPTAVAALDPALFVGDYAGEDVSTYRLGGMPEREERDPKARITVKRPDTEHAAAATTAIAIVLVDSSDGKDICTLTATVGEASAVIAPGQKCFEQTGSDATATATIRTGTATVEKRRLVVDLELDFEMHVPDQDATGTLLYHFDGTRR